MCLASRVLTGNMEMDKMSGLVEQVALAGWLQLPALSVVSDASVPASLPSPQHISQNHFQSTPGGALRLLAEFSH